MTNQNEQNVTIDIECLDFPVTKKTRRNLVKFVVSRIVSTVRAAIILVVALCTSYMMSHMIITKPIVVIGIILVAYIVAQITKAIVDILNQPDEYEI